MSKRKLVPQRVVQPSSMPRQAAWGRVEIKEDPGHEPLVHFNRSQADVTSKLCIWWPGKALQRQKQLLDSFAVALRCSTTADGERRFSPIGRGDRSFDPFLFFYARVCVRSCNSLQVSQDEQTSANFLSCDVLSVPTCAEDAPAHSPSFQEQEGPDHRQIRPRQEGRERIARLALGIQRND